MEMNNNNKKNYKAGLKTGKQEFSFKGYDQQRPGFSKPGLSYHGWRDLKKFHACASQWIFRIDGDFLNYRKFQSSNNKIVN